MTKQRHQRPVGWQIGVYPLPQVGASYHLGGNFPQPTYFYLQQRLCDRGYGYWVEWHLLHPWLRLGEAAFLRTVGKTWWGDT